MTCLMTGRCGPSVDDVDDDSAPTCRMTWLSSQARIPADFWRNFGELYRANYYNDKSHGGWRKVDKNVDNCYILHMGFVYNLLAIKLGPNEARKQVMQHLH